MIRLALIIFSFIFLECTSSSSYSEGNDSPINETDESVTSTEEVKKINIQKPKLGENQIVMGGDTLTISDDGKVYGARVLNDSIYYYRNFIGKKAETDIGDTFLKIREKNGLLISEIEIKEEYILDDGINIIAVNFKSNCVAHFSLLDNSNNVLCLDVSLSDANEFIGEDGKLYIKLVNEDDYSYSDVLIISSEDYSKEFLNFEYEGYLTLVNQDGSVALIDNDDKTIKVLN